MRISQSAQLAFDHFQVESEVSNRLSTGTTTSIPGIFLLSEKPVDPRSTGHDIYYFCQEGLRKSELGLAQVTVFTRNNNCWRDSLVCIKKAYYLEPGDITRLQVITPVSLLHREWDQLERHAGARRLLTAAARPPPDLTTLVPLALVLLWWRMMTWRQVGYKEG